MHVHMHLDREWYAVLMIWLGLMTVCGVFAVRIVTLLYRQHCAERLLRLHLAAAMGRAVRESSPPPGEPA